MSASASAPRSTARMLSDILDRKTKAKLLLAALVAGALAIIETVAIVTVLPLVNIATGAPIDSGYIGVIWRALGEPARATFGLILVIGVVGLFIIKDLATMAYTWWQTGFIARERIRLSVRIFRNVMQSPFADFRTRSTGEVFRTMTAAVGQTFTSVVNGLLTLVSGGLTALAIILALIITTPLQALLALVYFFVGAYAYIRIIRPRITRAGDLMMSGSVTSTIAGFQGLNGFKEVKLRNSSEIFVQRFEEGITATERAAREGNFFSSITKYLLEILFMLGIGALLVISFATGAAEAAVGSLALFVAAGFRLLPNISLLISAINGFRLGRASLQIVYDELSTSETGGKPAQARMPMRFSEDLELSGVTFQYPGASKPVIAGIDLTIPYGSTVAFVGGSGAGKTTLADLVMGLLEPTSGSIRADGTDVSTDLLAWQKNVAMVAQDVFVTEKSIADNILFDVDPDDADPDRLAAAIEGAQLNDVVESLPGGLDASAGEWGGRLSGGQRQRVGIARALYRTPRLLILDEATSALDNETERRITETIDSLSGRVTVVVIAHRLSTVKNVDTIVFLKDGKVAGAGGFHELQRTNTEFANLVRLGDLGETPGDKATGLSEPSDPRP